MKIERIICDGCGAEITGERFRAMIYAVGEDGKYLPRVKGPRKDFCEACSSALTEVIENFKGEKRADAEENSEEDVKEAAVEDEPGILANKNQGGRGTDHAADMETEDAGEENVPPEEKTAEVSTNGAEACADSDKSVRQLILDGKTTDEICAIKGCKKGTVFSIRSKMKRDGEITVPAKKECEPVDCRKVIKKCVYASKCGNMDICDYIGVTGKMRKCPLEACTKFQRRK